MKKITKFSALLFIGLGLSTNAQNNPESTCGTGVPSQQWEAQFQQLLQQTVANRTANKSQQQAYTVPVIIHVIHGGQNVGVYPNLAQAQLNSQIQVLNNDFAGTGFNSGNYPATAFATWAATNNISANSLDANGRVAIANTGVQFCLALVDPNGNVLPEPGIDRRNYNTYGWGNPANPSLDYAAFKNLMDGTIKPQTIWDVTRYLNIWVSDGYLNSTGGLLGYATFPPLSTLSGLGFAPGTSTTDGFWCYAQAFGSSLVYSNGTYMAGYNRGRTCTHEIGHWVGLRHIWGDAQCATDYCADTPPARASNSGAPLYPYNATGANSCPGNSPNGQMFMNFMDYTNDPAKYMFTTDQADRIQTAMANSPYRKFLGTHNLCSVSNVAATALFNSSNAACTGVGLTLTNNSTGWPPPSYTWAANGGTFSPTPQVVSPVINFDTPGVYVVTLTSSNGTTSVYSKTITVTSPTIYLSSTSQTVCEGSTALFYANGVDSYTWQPGNVQNAIGTFSPNTSTTYTCFGTEINNCKTSAIVEVVVSPCVGIDSYLRDEFNLAVYPNPAKDILNVQVNAGTAAELVIEITDAVGRTIRQERVNTTAGSLLHPVEISSFDNGIYFIKIQNTNGAAQTVKFVKSN